MKLEQDIAHVKAKLETEKAILNQVTKQIQTKVNLDKVPKKGAFGYKTDDVESFVQSVELASLKQAMSRQYPQISEVDSQYYKEVQRLQGVERQYKELIDSPERLQGRLDVLRDEENKRNISATIEYVLGERVSSIHNCTIKETSEGKEIFAIYRLSSSPKLYALSITPDESLYYTSDSRVTDIDKANELSQEHIWESKGRIPEIRQERYKNDVKERYSNKLTSLLRTDISVHSFVEGNGELLLFADNGRRYWVLKNVDVWSTGDERVKTVADCKRLSSEKIWKNDGNVNEISRSVNRGRGMHR